MSNAWCVECVFYLPRGVAGKSDYTVTENIELHVMDTPEKIQLVARSIVLGDLVVLERPRVSQSMFFQLQSMEQAARNIGTAKIKIFVSVAINFAIKRLREDAAFAESRSAAMERFVLSLPVTKNLFVIRGAS